VAQAASLFVAFFLWRAMVALPGAYRYGDLVRKVHHDFCVVVRDSFTFQPIGESNCLLKGSTCGTISTPKCPLFDELLCLVSQKWIADRLRVPWRGISAEHCSVY